MTELVLAPVFSMKHVVRSSGEGDSGGKKYQKLEERKEGMKFIVMSEKVSLLEDKVGCGIYLLSVHLFFCHALIQ